MDIFGRGRGNEAEMLQKDTVGMDDGKWECEEVVKIEDREQL